MKSEAWIKGRMEYERRAKEYWQDAFNQSNDTFSKNTYSLLAAKHEACERLLIQIIEDVK